MWEYKFVFRDDRMAEALFDLLGKLDEIAGYGCAKKEQVTYEDHYFDTEDLCLDALGMVCRVRSEDAATGSTLSIKRQSLGPNREPVYLESAPLHLDEAAFQRMREGELPEGYRDILQVFAGKQTIRNLLNLRVRRTVLALSDESREIAHLHLDSFEVLLPGSDQQRTVKGYEIELKTPMGREVFPEADVLQDYLRSALNLIPVTRSKARGLYHILQKGNKGKSPQKVILDMDTGVDDALAILLAMHSPELEVIGITTTGGNIAAEQAARNSSAVLQALARFSPSVAARYHVGLPPVASWREDPGPAPGEPSEEKPKPRDASDVHGPDGLGGLSRMEPYIGFYEKGTLSNEESALDLFKRLVHSHDAGTVVLITTGPLSNLAEWVKKAPESVKLLREILSMGGVFFESGNRSQAAEFNIHADPGSARKVVEFCREPSSSSRYTWRETIPLTFVGLDVTHRVTLRRPTLAKTRALLEARLKAAENPEDIENRLKLVDFVETFTRYYMDFYYRNEGLDGCYLHDPLAVGYLIDPSLCQVEQYPVEVEDRGEFTSGMTVADYRPTRIFKNRMKEVTRICYKVDARRFEEFFMERVFGPMRT